MIRPRWDRLAIAAALAVFWAGVVTGFIRACSQAEGQHVPAVERPPARFIQPEQVAFVHFLPPGRVAEVCGPRHLGCASVGGAQVWMPHPCAFPRDGYAVLMCHELGHNAGWTAAHER
jgi:hypothetical protein